MRTVDIAFEPTEPLERATMNENVTFGVIWVGKTFSGKSTFQLITKMEERTFASCSVSY